MKKWCRNCKEEVIVKKILISDGDEEDETYSFVCTKCGGCIEIERKE